MSHIWVSFPRLGIWCSNFPFFDIINSNGVIGIMTFKLLRKICWIDNSLWTLGEKIENFLKNLKIWINFSNFKFFNKSSKKVKNLTNLFKFSENFQLFFQGAQWIIYQTYFRNDLKVIIPITPLLFITSKKGKSEHQIPVLRKLSHI